MRKLGVVAFALLVVVVIAGEDFGVKYGNSDTPDPVETVLWAVNPEKATVLLYREREGGVSYFLSRDGDFFAIDNDSYNCECLQHKNVKPSYDAPDSAQPWWGILHGHPGAFHKSSDTLWSWNASSCDGHQSYGKMYFDKDANGDLIPVNYTNVEWAEMRGCNEIHDDTYVFTNYQLLSFAEANATGTKLLEKACPNLGPCKVIEALE
mmetsp:Transcript_16565/g.35895  ORF Transcript_16565/g.35895 Transcript_16565/m.35895 type:complete len:208 (-) Transcript_16565:28-651(-)